MVAVPLREHAPRGQGWQPDRRASTMLAFLAAMLACLGFLGLLYRPPQPIAGSRVTSLFLQAPLPAKTIRRQIAHAVRPRSLAPMAPQTLTIPAPPILLETPQDLLDAGTSEYPEEQGTNGVFIQLPERYDELSRALRATSKPAALPDGGTYRSLYGASVMRSGDFCVEIRETQTGPAPANKVLVDFSVPCPGSYRPTMEDKLSAWAKKIKAGQLPPP